ncbi:Spermidine hydroxycinnamoyl transferase [Linum perenne]
MIQTLKHSLSHILVPFYPMAGRLQWTPSGGARIELDCNGAGVQLVEAESDSTLQDFGDFSPTPEFLHLSAEVDYSTLPVEEWPMLTVQLTHLSCGGVCLGLNICHAIVDGQSALHFFTEWARVARGEPVSKSPVFDPRVFRAGEEATEPPRFDHNEYDPLPTMLSTTTVDRLEINDDGLRVVVHEVMISESQIMKLKEKANEGKQVANGYRRYSSFETITGIQNTILTRHMWRSLCRARRLNREQPTAITVTVDLRRRVNPPPPDGFFGNAVKDAVAISISDEIVSNRLGFACGKIREAIETVNHDYVQSAIDYLKLQPDLSKFRHEMDGGSDDSGAAAAMGSPNLSVISWSRLPLYGLDFGWGEEVHMGPGYHDGDGDALLLAGDGGGGGDGSATVKICLKVEHVEEFDKYFYEGI